MSSKLYSTYTVSEKEIMEVINKQYLSENVALHVASGGLFAAPGLEVA
jgi:hypothetical protein